jgi:3-deoxy-manno-octulosonate cytidylyltransferase (CMP-KDO synthetase)
LEQLEQLRALEHGYRIRVVQTPYDSIGVDVPADVARVERLLAAQNRA